MFKTLTIALCLHLSLIGPSSDGLLCELFKVENLIEHFQIHLEEEGEDLTFMQFINEHFGGSDHNGDHSSEELPWTSIHVLVNSMTQTSVLKYSFEQSILPEICSAIPFFETLVISDICCQIDHPPS